MVTKMADPHLQVHLIRRRCRCGTLTISQLRIKTGLILIVDLFQFSFLIIIALFIDNYTDWVIEIVEKSAWWAFLFFTRFVFPISGRWCWVWLVRLTIFGILTGVINVIHVILLVLVLVLVSIVRISLKIKR